MLGQEQQTLHLTGFFLNKATQSEISLEYQPT